MFKGKASSNEQVTLVTVQLGGLLQGGQDHGCRGGREGGAERQEQIPSAVMPQEDFGFVLNGMRNPKSL